MPSRSVRYLAVFALVGLAALVTPLAAPADDGGDDEADVRVERRCTDGSRIRLRARENDDALRVVLDVRTTRRSARWLVVVVHERRFVLRAVRRPGQRSRSFTVRLTVPDWPGRDTVVARALGPRGQLCRAALTVPGA
ncbi:MAG: hypothetical protein M5U27_08955 [Gaiella sp.]|nr:hypothetical protein [Gaiella sp.]